MNWRAEIEAAAGRIAGHVLRTPVLTADVGAGLPVELKLEQI